MNFFLSIGMHWYNTSIDIGIIPKFISVKITKKLRYFFHKMKKKKCKISQIKAELINIRKISSSI